MTIVDERSVKRRACGLFVALVVLAGAQSAAQPRPPDLDIVKDKLIQYHDTGAYERDIGQTVHRAESWLARRMKQRRADERLALVLDVDETALSNWAILGPKRFDCIETSWVSWAKRGESPAIPPVLALYRLASSRGLSVFFLSGRPESLRAATESNLRSVGYLEWAGLLLRAESDHSQAAELKVAMRRGISAKGFQIVLNIGDQPADVSGCCAEKHVLLPNPFYRDRNRR